ncbi:hypothetical protein ACHWQZ_G016491 [Mnemiopsis leidyi]
MKKVTEMSWVKDFREFANDTSAHGVKYIFEGRYKLVKLLFLVTWLGFSIYACHVIITSIVRFVEKPTSTKYEVIQDDSEGRPERIEFPTISVCSMNKVRKSYLEAPENEAIREYYEVVDKYNVSLVKDLAKRFKNSDDPLHSIKDMTYEELIRNGGPNPDRLLKCTQRAKYCHELPAFNGRDVSVMENSMTGNCWRVNPEGRLMGKMGDYGAMKLMFWADVQDYSARTADVENQGFVVAFHDNSTYGSTMTAGFLMSPGTYYKADLRRKQEIRNRDKIESCNASLTENTYGAYNEGSCALECKDEALHKACGCTNVVPPLNNGKYKSCTLEQWVDCGLAVYKEWFHNFTDTDRADQLCPCQIQCEEVRYEAQISSSSISPAFAEKLFPSVQPIISQPQYGYSNPDFNILYNTTQDILDNVMVLEVLFTSMRTNEIKEIISYGLSNLLGDIGGVLGLFLGASLFTILEVFQFVFFSISKYCFDKGQPKHDSLTNGDKLSI